jgi:hypothetical protein
VSINYGQYLWPLPPYLPQFKKLGEGGRSHSIFAMDGYYECDDEYELKKEDL